MKRTEKVRFQRLTATALSAIVLAVAGLVAAVPCHLFYFQPKTPQNMKARLARR